MKYNSMIFRSIVLYTLINNHSCQSIVIRKDSEDVMDWGSSLAGIDINEYSKDAPGGYVPPEPKKVDPEEERQMIEKTRLGPKGVGKGSVTRNDGTHGRRDLHSHGKV